MLKTLDEIALGYGTDKSSTKHNYTRLYAAYFEPLRNKPLKVFEIGAANGHSLKMWKEYFPNAHILSIDIEDSRALNEERIAVEQGDQADTAFLKRLNEKYGPFDIIIDDGSHVNRDMKITFDYLFPLLKPDGIFVVEDLHACYWPELDPSGTHEFIGRLKELVDSVNSSGKSGTANRALDSVDAHLQNNKAQFTWWESSVEFVHFYRSIVFIKKYATEGHGTTSVIDVPHLFFRAKRKLRFVWKKVHEVAWAKKAKLEKLKKQD